MRKISLLVSYFIIASTVSGQLRLDTSMTADELVKKVLLGENSDLIIKNVSYIGKPFSIAAFQNESPEELMDAGILLSTGDVFDARGPNKAVNTGVRSSARRDNDLQAIATGVVTDAAVLEFDLLALRDSLVFEYVFASDEYPEYVDKGVNDVFAFFIQEVGGRALRPLNIARIPNSRKAVSIDNVNHRTNENYFLRSDFLSAHSNEFWEQNKAMMMRARIFEFDGFTVPLKAVARLKEGRTYHLKIAIADVGDRFFDSGVMLKANSFTAKGKRIAKADSIVKAELTKNISQKNSKKFQLKDNLTFSLIINFNTDEALIQEDSFEELNELVQMMSSFPDLRIEIVGHTDNVGTAERNLQLSQRRAEAVKTYLEKQGIEMNRLTSIGKGENEFIADNLSEATRAQNRRVEFKLSY